MPAISFDVVGAPRPQGSKRAFVIGHGKASVSDVNPVPLDNYRSDIRAAAMAAMKGIPVCQTAAYVSVVFKISRPESHYLSGGRLTRAARSFPRSPDVDKAARAVMDALTDVVLKDDSSVTDLRAFKAYIPFGEVSHTSIVVTW